MIIQQQWIRTWSTVLVFETNQSDRLQAAHPYNPVPLVSPMAADLWSSSLCNPHKKAQGDVIFSSGIADVSQSVSHNAVRDSNCGRPEQLLVPARDKKLRHTRSYSYCFLLLFISPSSCYSSSSFSSCFTLFSSSLFISFLFSSLETFVLLYYMTFWQQQAYCHPGLDTV
jgi:hypothetical protein